ncbi:hypothetical protein [Pyrodictium occultum]|uniref:hypothetical protein n=1 Tax=Pyrodictium occultum TaxID=2309 RepID=UPI0014434314|nr:hypothetical protein [Pyrodictium occultum]
MGTVRASEAARVAGELAHSYSSLAEAVKEAAAAMGSVSRLLEHEHIGRLDRIRVLAALAGAPSILVALATGAPPYIVAYRVAGMALNLARAGRRTKIVLEEYLLFSRMPEELAALAL